MITKKQTLRVLTSILNDYGYNYEHLYLKQYYGNIETIRLNLVCNKEIFGSNIFPSKSANPRNVISYIKFDFHRRGCDIYFYSSVSSYNILVAKNILSAKEFRNSLNNSFKEVGLLSKDEAMIKDIIE
jgi:hypothetical protein